MPSRFKSLVSGLPCAILVAVAGWMTGCSHVPTAEEMSIYTTVQVYPLSGLSGVDAFKVPTGFQKAVDAAVLEVLTEKGYIITEAKDRADFTVTSSLARGVAPNPANYGTRPEDAAPFEPQLETATLNFVLTARDGKRIWQTSTGSQWPLRLLTNARIKTLVRDAFEDLPVKTTADPVSAAITPNPKTAP